MKTATLDNPYLDLFTKLELDTHRGRLGGLFGNSTARDALIMQYAWAVPNQAAIETIARYSPILELGAGSGYWASLIAAAGAQITCFDNQSYCYSSKEWMYANRTHYAINQGDESVLLTGDYADHALMLCWPDYADPFAANALKIYQGQTVIYIGESDGGCTGDNEFHDLLYTDFDEIEEVTIPQHYGLHDRLWVYRRKSESVTNKQKG